MEKTVSCLCFDFDGTLVESYPLFVQKIQALAQEFKYRLISDEEAESLRDEAPKAIIQYLRLPHYKVPLLARRLRQEMAKEIPYLRLVKGMEEVLPLLRDKGYTLGLITSNSEKNVRHFLQLHDLDFFNFYACGSSLFGKGGLLKKSLKKRNIERGETLYIGDEIRDNQAAQKAGTLFGAVTWGYNTPDSLEREGPEHIFHSPGEIKEKLLD